MRRALAFSAALFMGCYSIMLLKQAVYSADCTGITASCSGWGAFGANPGPYPGYCCAPQIPQLVPCAAPAFTNGYALTPASVNVPINPQCGTLQLQTYDNINLVYNCGANLAGFACGGGGAIPQGGGIGCKKVQCPAAS